ALAPLQRRRLDDGHLDVRLLHSGSRAGAAASLTFGRRASAALRALRLLPRRIEAGRAESIDRVPRPREGQPPGFAHGGEVAISAPRDATAASQGRAYRTRIEIVRGALEVYRPASSGPARRGEQ